jgi:hypothetical protein
VHVDHPFRDGLSAAGRRMGRARVAPGLVDVGSSVHSFIATNGRVT